MPEVSVANFNLHAGVDGWGRPFDVIRACKLIDTDVIALEEVFWQDGETSQAHQIAEALGYGVIEAPLGRLTVREPTVKLVGPPKSWGPRPMVRGVFSSVAVERQKASTRRTRPVTRRRGSIGIALLYRVELGTTREFALPTLSRDKLDRRAIEIRTVDGLSVIATHLGHILQGSYKQMLALRHEKDAIDGPIAIVGDMNCWGPPLAVLIGAQRAVRGPSWPAWQPHSQIDHILIANGIRALAGEVFETLGSDHRPIRATLAY